MHAQVVEAPEYTKNVFPNQLFLAGGISNCPNWQSHAIERLSLLPITIYNPRRENFNLLDSSESEAQIDWEFVHLRQATEVMFWFAPETVCPITLFELGGRLEANRVTDPFMQWLIIGSHLEYKRIFDVRYQAGKKGWPVFTNLDDMLDIIIKRHNRE
jgi:hypothetical protein